jgi:hypothetical protein
MASAIAVPWLLSIDRLLNRSEYKGWKEGSEVAGWWKL